MRRLFTGLLALGLSLGLLTTFTTVASAQVKVEKAFARDNVQSTSVNPVNEYYDNDDYNRYDRDYRNDRRYRHNDRRYRDNYDNRRHYNYDNDERYYNRGYHRGDGHRRHGHDRGWGHRGGQHRGW